MPTAGLSLVGFIDDPNQAVTHLSAVCVPAAGTLPPALVASWTAAKISLGSPIPNAGQPTLTPISLTHPHIQALLASPWGNVIKLILQDGAQFQMVEIEPLLAFEQVIDTERADYHCNHLSNPPTPDELFSVCLPTSAPSDDWKQSFSGQTVIVRSRSRNLKIVRGGPLRIQGVPNVVGIQFGWKLPAVHVVRFNGRCYLHNGYHRALGCALRGAKAMPCLFRDVQLPGQVGITPPETFSQALLESPNPPTLGHFIHRRALAVQLRVRSRMIQVNWSEHVIAEE
jgi:hypothetical protein